MRAAQTGEDAEAEVLFQRSLGESAHFKTYEQLGDLAQRRGDLVAATTFYAAAVGLGVNQVRPRQLLASVLAQRGEIYSAAMKLAEAHRLNPQYKSAAEDLSRLRAFLAPTADTRHIRADGSGRCADSSEESLRQICGVSGAE